MTAITILTPLHAPGNAFIEETYDSLRDQTEIDWSWLLLENSGGVVPDRVRSDPRVRVRVAPAGSHGIGWLKRALSDASETRFALELDADDLLDPHAVAHVLGVFEKGADFVYSDFAEFKEGLATWDGYPYGSLYGWEHYQVKFRGRDLLAMRAPEVTSHNVRLVDWSPNHVRAWRKTAYDRAGGHSRQLEVADDHDLIVRMVLDGARFGHVPECLYFYRVHEKNTVASKNAAIRQGTEAVYNRQIWPLAERFTQECGLSKVDLCGGIDTPAGYLALDRHVPKDVPGLSCDLDKEWPLPDSSVGVLRAHDAVEHLRDPIHTMNEAWRVLAHGGFFMIHVPSTNGLGAFCDPTHRSFWNRLSFRYYTDARFARYVPDFKGRFQVSRVIEWFPSDWHRQENVPYVEAHLFALKDGPRIMGELLW